MKRSSSELKKMALATLTGRWGLPLGVCFLVTLITSLVPLFFTFRDFYSEAPQTINALVLNEGITLIFSLIGSVFSAGLTYLFLNLCRGKEYKLSDILYAFKNHPDRFILASFFLLLIGLIFNLPSLILSYSLIGNEPHATSLSFLILALSLLGILLTMIVTLHFAIVMELLLDHTELSAIQALKKSAQLMKGNKWRCFYIQLSFFGWVLLSVLTCYIAMLWVVPYMTTTLGYFYLDVIGELDHTTDHDMKSENPTEYFSPDQFDANPYKKESDTPKISEQSLQQRKDSNTDYVQYSPEDYYPHN